MLLRYDEDEEKRKQWLEKEKAKFKEEYEYNAARLKLQFDRRLKEMRDEEERSHESAIIKLRRLLSERYEHEQMVLIDAHTEEMKRLRSTLDVISSKRSHTAMFRDRAAASGNGKGNSLSYSLPGDDKQFVYSNANMEIPKVNEGPPDLYVKENQKD